MSDFDRIPETLSGEYKRRCPDCDTIGSRADRFCAGCGRSFRDTGAAIGDASDEVAGDD